MTRAHIPQSSDRGRPQTPADWSIKVRRPAEPGQPGKGSLPTQPP